MPCAFLIINHSKYYCKINRIIWWARCTSKSKGEKFNCTFCNIFRGIELFCWVFLSSGTLYTKVNSKAMNQKHGLKKYCNKLHESHRENEPLEHAAMPSVHRFPLQETSCFHLCPNMLYCLKFILPLSLVVTGCQMVCWLVAWTNIDEWQSSVSFVLPTWNSKTEFIAQRIYRLYCSTPKLVNCSLIFNIWTKYFCLLWYRFFPWNKYGYLFTHVKWQLFALRWICKVFKNAWTRKNLFIIIIFLFFIFMYIFFIFIWIINQLPQYYFFFFIKSYLSFHDL